MFKLRIYGQGQDICEIVVNGTVEGIDFRNQMAENLVLELSNDDGTVQCVTMPNVRTVMAMPRPYLKAPASDPQPDAVVEGEPQ